MINYSELIRKHARFKFKDKDALLKKAKELGIDLPFSDDIQILFERGI